MNWHITLNFLGDIEGKWVNPLVELGERVAHESVAGELTLDSLQWWPSSERPRLLAAVAAHREEFEFEKHAGGANMDATPRQIIARLEGYSGVKLSEAFAIPDLDRQVKWHCKYARQNGIHVSPTFMIDGLIHPEIGSGDAVSAWVAKLAG